MYTKSRRIFKGFSSSISSAENKEEAIAVQRCSVEKQKGTKNATNAIDFVHAVIAPFWFSTEHL